MERRTGFDRRSHPRGGRRPTDRQGYSPLVMVIEPDEGRREVTEAILVRLRFAVVPVESIERAVSLSHAIRPSVIVCVESDASACRALLSIPIPVVPFVDDADTLIDRIREAIRAAKVVPFEPARNR